MKTEKELPYYRLWVKDFDTNENVRVLDLAELGLYLSCLNHSWINDGLPADPALIARVLKVPRGQFNRLWQRVGKCFHLEGDRLINSRQEEERAKAITKSRQSSDAVAERERKRIGRSSDDHPRAQTRAGSDSVFEDFKKETSLLENSPAGRHIGDWVDRLYGRHPKKKNRPLVESFLAALLEIWEPRAKRAGVKTRDELFLLIDRAHEDACRSLDWHKEHAKFCPSLDKWLDDEGYTAHGARASPAEQLPPDTPSLIAIWKAEKAAAEARGEEY